MKIKESLHRILSGSSYELYGSNLYNINLREKEMIWNPSLICATQVYPNLAPAFYRLRRHHRAITRWSHVHRALNLHFTNLVLSLLFWASCNIFVKNTSGPAIGCHHEYSCVYLYVTNFVFTFPQIYDI